MEYYRTIILNGEYINFEGIRPEFADWMGDIKQLEDF